MYYMRAGVRSSCLIRDSEEELGRLTLAFGAARLGFVANSTVFRISFDMFEARTSDREKSDVARGGRDGLTTRLEWLSGGHSSL